MTAVLGPDRAEVWAYSFKEGMLSAVGHDLKLAFDRFSLTVTPGRIDAEIELGSVRTVCARRARADAPGVLSENDARQIEENTRGPVLEVTRFATAQFRCSGIDRDDPDEWEVAGQLSLHGVHRPVRGTARREGAWRVARFSLSQSDYGIRPFAALLGTLRVQARVDVEIRVPEDALAALDG